MWIFLSLEFCIQSSMNRSLGASSIPGRRSATPQLATHNVHYRKIVGAVVPPPLSFRHLLLSPPRCRRCHFHSHRGLVHAYWAPNGWALYLFLDRASLAALKLAGVVGAAVGKGSTTGKAARHGHGR